MLSVQEIKNTYCKLGENPLWDSQKNVLYWTDIDCGKLYTFDYLNKEIKCIYKGEKVGGFTLQQDGKLLLFRINDIIIYDPISCELIKVYKIKNAKFERFNDVIATPNVY
jgi:D-xylono/L-arabinono-1,4-lactonase